MLDNLFGETAKSTEAAKSTTAAGGAGTSAPAGNNPIATDTTSSNVPNDFHAGSQILGDVASAYNLMEEGLEKMFSELKNKAKDDEGSKGSQPIAAPQRDLTRIKIKD